MAFVIGVSGVGSIWKAVVGVGVGVTEPPEAGVKVVIFSKAHFGVGIGVTSKAGPDSAALTVTNMSSKCNPLR